MEHGYTVPNLGRSLGSGVAAEADFNQSIFFNGSMQFFWGGTSFACPTTAGEFALIEDYLAHNGQNPYLGDGDGPVFDVANAYWNGNLTLVPFYDVVSKAGVSANGTSYWGNFGVAERLQLPIGPEVPVHGAGQHDLRQHPARLGLPDRLGPDHRLQLRAGPSTRSSQMPATFMTTNAAGTAYDTGAWDWMQLNHTYTVHINATSALILIQSDCHCGLPRP